MPRWYTLAKEILEGKDGKAMAQDFGDDMGSALLSSAQRMFDYAFRPDRNGNSLAKDWWQKRFQKDGTPSVEAARLAEEKAAREQIVLPLGSADDAATYASVCRANGLYASAYTDRDGNGFLAFAKEDAALVANLSSAFAKASTQIQDARICALLEQATPLTHEAFLRLTEVPKYPQLEPEDTAKEEEISQPSFEEPTPEDAKNHTEKIKDAAEELLPSCTDFADFKRRMGEKGIGITLSQNRELMLYEPKELGEGGEIPDFSPHRDWAVRAGKLKETYGVPFPDAWLSADKADFPAGEAPAQEAEEKPPVATDGALDTDGSTPDINQGFESYDSADTDPHTARVEREQSGTDVAPSMVREEEAQAEDAAKETDSYSLASEAADMRKAAQALDKAGNAKEHVQDIAHPTDPVR